MPRPPILPTVDWESVFQSGAAYSEWLSACESQKNRKRIEDTQKALFVSSEIAAFLEALPKTVNVLAFAEDWCGDVLRHVPVLAKLAELSSKINVRYVSREEHPEVFVRFLTNGGEAIPKFVFLSQDFVECGNWGPMPSQHRELISRGKAANDVGSARKMVSTLYDADSEMEEVIAELLHCFDIASSVNPDC